MAAAKCALAARVDSCHESADGQVGQLFREEIEKKLEKLQVNKIIYFVPLNVTSFVVLCSIKFR